MSLVKMHTGEVETDKFLVERLLTAQFPRWADLTITPVPSSGTDNALYRLGDVLVVRLPRIDWAVGQIDKDCLWLPKLAPYLPLKIPLPLAKGEPAEGYPWHWGIYRWIEGENSTLQAVVDPNQTALDLAEFLLALQGMDPAGGPPAERNSRGAALKMRDIVTRDAIATLADLFDTEKLISAWESASQAPVWDRAPVWFHGDILPGNLLFQQGRLSAVIDFSGLGVGDPACDLMIAWGFFSGESRRVFRQALEVDDATWKRGRAHALSQALIFIPYYLETNPVGVANARHMLNEVLADQLVH